MSKLSKRARIVRLQAKIYAQLIDLFDQGMELEYEHPDHPDLDKIERRYDQLEARDEHLAHISAERWAQDNDEYLV